MIDSRQIDPRTIRPADAPQLPVGKRELGRMAIRVQTDFTNAIADHDTRMARFQAMYRSWRGRTEDLSADDYLVPLVQWQTYAKWAKETASLFGENAEVVAKPVGPDDQRRTRKIARYVTWMLFRFDEDPEPSRRLQFPENPLR